MAVTSPKLELANQLNAQYTRQLEKVAAERRTRETVDAERAAEAKRAAQVADERLAQNAAQARRTELARQSGQSDEYIQRTGAPQASGNGEVQRLEAQRAEQVRQADLVAEARRTQQAEAARQTQAAEETRRLDEVQRLRAQQLATELARTDEERQAAVQRALLSDRATPRGSIVDIYA
ncbi:MAG TPA: hypothetical protein VIN57_03625 [Magnetovibrio sp.]